jgi:hypothetical protein
MRKSDAMKRLRVKRTTTVEVLEAEFRALDIPFKIEKTGGQHLRWRFFHGGTERQIVTPSTPSDRRGPLEARSDLRPLVKRIEQLS